MARKYNIHHVPGKALSFDQRKLLAIDWNRLIHEGKKPSLRAFAKEHGLPYSTWKREYDRGKLAKTVPDPKCTCRRIYGEYDPQLAQEKVDESVSNRGPRVILTNMIDAELKRLIIDEKRSPYDAWKRLVKMFPDKRVPCVRTLYNHIAHGDSSVHYGDTPYHPKRRSRSGPKPHPARTCPEHASIDDRPAAANNRSEPGHFEMDTVVSCLGGSGGLLVLIDRMTRLYFIELLEAISQNDVDKALRRMKARGAFAEIKSMTTDNGCEFLDDKALRKTLGCEVYYTRAYASWEKGSVENCNRIVRRWYPKGTNFAECSKADISRLEAAINSIHRMSLGGMTAAQFAKQHKGVA